MRKGTLLIVDDNKGILVALKQITQNEFENVITLTDPNRINETLRKNDVGIVMLDMNFKSGIHNGNEGLFWMREIFSHDRNISIIVVTALTDLELAVKAMKEGAVDFIPKPWDNTRLIATINVAWELRLSRLEANNLKSDNQLLKKEINKGGEKIVLGASPTMINVMNIVRKVAGTDANILITGENGTGKEVIAREIHNRSKRCNELFVLVDLNSLSESLFESELYGHKKGSFTNAYEDKTGRFTMAD